MVSSFSVLCNSSSYSVAESCFYIYMEMYMSCQSGKFCRI